MSWRSRPTFVALTWWPRAINSSASFALLLVVHRSGDSGSPRVTGSTSASRSWLSVGSFSVRGLRPPPGRRILWCCGFSVGGHALTSSRSRIPNRILFSRIPVAAVTIAAPPRPNARASAAAHSRVTRSSITHRRTANFSRTRSTSAIVHAEPSRAREYFHPTLHHSIISTGSLSVGYLSIRGGFHRTLSISYLDE